MELILMDIGLHVAPRWILKLVERIVQYNRDHVG